MLLRKLETLIFLMMSTVHFSVSSSLFFFSKAMPILKAICKRFITEKSLFNSKVILFRSFWRLVSAFSLIGIVSPRTLNQTTMFYWVYYSTPLAVSGRNVSRQWLVYRNTAFTMLFRTRQRPVLPVIQRVPTFPVLNICCMITDVLSRE